MRRPFGGAQILRNLVADLLLLAGDGFGPEAGTSRPDILEAQLNSLMMVAREVTVVTDASKFGRRGLL